MKWKGVCGKGAEQTEHNTRERLMEAAGSINTVGPLLMSTSLWVPPVWVLDHVKLISVLIASTN